MIRSIFPIYTILGHTLQRAAVDQGKDDDKFTAVEGLAVNHQSVCLPLSHQLSPVSGIPLHPLTICRHYRFIIGAGEGVVGWGEQWAIHSEPGPMIGTAFGIGKSI
jgi:hypothetical protein